MRTSLAIAVTDKKQDIMSCFLSSTIALLHVSMIDTCYRAIVARPSFLMMMHAARFHRYIHYRAIKLHQGKACSIHVKPLLSGTNAQSDAERRTFVTHTSM